jgi:putative NIF3 family GTP cyclohydrolase 1 type 2
LGLAAAAATQISLAETDREFTAGDLQRYLKSLDGGWVDRDRTVDTFKSGSPDVAVTGIAIAWMSDTEALERAHELGCNVFVTHEPTFYNHFDFESDIFRDFPVGWIEFNETFANEAVRAKRKFIDNIGITILRCHDLWDQMPAIGITDAWAAQLGFTDPVGSESFYRIYDVAGRTAGDVAEQVARATKPLGQEAVQLIGSAGQAVNRVAIGTGAITPMFHMIATGNADLVICSDDGFVYWRDGPMASDMGVPIVIAHHGCTEVPGMKLLAEHLKTEFPDIPVHFIPQPCMYTLIRV